jgi:hypothetical protein
VLVAASSADARVAAVAAALAPYPWRGFTDRMLARRVVAAADRHELTVFVSGLAGADVGAFEPVHAADPGDGRVEALVRVLGHRRWRGSSLDRLCVDLVASLDAWQRARDSLDDDRRRRLGGR